MPYSGDFNKDCPEKSSSINIYAISITLTRAFLAQQYEKANKQQRIELLQTPYERLEQKIDKYLKDKFYNCYKHGDGKTGVSQVRDSQRGLDLIYVFMNHWLDALKNKDIDEGIDQYYKAIGDSDKNGKE